MRCRDAISGYDAMTSTKMKHAYIAPESTKPIKLLRSSRQKTDEIAGV